MSAPAQVDEHHHREPTETSPPRVAAAVDFVAEVITFTALARRIDTRRHRQRELD